MQHLKIHLAKIKACTNAQFRMVNTDDGSLNVPSDHEVIDNTFELDHALDEEATMFWDCLQPWDRTSEEASSSSSEDDIDTEDEGDDDNPCIEPLISPEFVTAHGLCFTPSDYAETKLLKLLNNVHAPHFLFQDVLNNWVKEAKQLHYDFCPQVVRR
jgi:hypothetical protein